MLTGHGEQSSPSQRPWPPLVQEVSNESPPLSPAEALKTFSLPPGYSVELVASEPLVQDPVAMPKPQPRQINAELAEPGEKPLTAPRPFPKHMRLPNGREPFDSVPSSRLVKPAAHALVVYRGDLEKPRSTFSRLVIAHPPSTCY